MYMLSLTHYSVEESLVHAHTITPQFPLLHDRVRGEESREFSSSSGGPITVQVCATEPETTALLGRVLEGHPTAAALLARAVHDESLEPALPEELLSSLQKVAVDVSQLGVWIDPIGMKYTVGYLLEL